MSRPTFNATVSRDLHQKFSPKTRHRVARDETSDDSLSDMCFSLFLAFREMPERAEYEGEKEREKK